MVRIQDRDIKERIQEKILINENGCWIWTGCKNSHGYGVISYLGKLGTASRIAWRAYKGDIVKGLDVCHNCPKGDNPACCNPEPMFLGTRKENIKDCQKKTGHQIGENNHRAILNEEKVLKIREFHKQGMSTKEIAEYFGIKYFTCLDVTNRRNWQHL